MEYRFEDTRIGQKGELKIQGNNYELTSNANIGEVKKRIKGSLEQRKIAVFTESSSGMLTKTICELEAKLIDEYGFVTTQQLSSQKGEEIISRDGLNVFTEKGENIKWDGGILVLNRANCDVRTIIENIAKTIHKYPKSKEYYESLMGKDMIAQIVNIRKIGE